MQTLRITTLLSNKLVDINKLDKLRRNDVRLRAIKIYMKTGCQSCLNKFCSVAELRHIL